MGRKKKNRTATRARKIGKSRLNPRPAKRKPSAKKKKAIAAVMPVLDAGKLKDLYSTMAKCRMLAERIYGNPSLGAQPGQLVSGLEAMLVGAGAHLLQQDGVALEHGGSIASLIKGTPLRMILSRSVMASGDLTGAPELTMKTALTLAREMKGRGAVTMMFCPKGTGTLAFEPEAMGLAAAEKLPLVALVETSFDVETETHDAAPAAVDSMYYPRIMVDGCDVVAVFRVAQEAVRRAREGHGPALIECVAAQKDGLASDNGAGVSAQNDPLVFMEQYLRRRMLWSDEWSRSMVAAFTRELDEAIAAAPGAAGYDSQFDNVYSGDLARPQDRSQPRLPQAVPAQ
jgi:pyruvate dehydrogenase E1 component alpha subunit